VYPIVNYVNIKICKYIYPSKFARPSTQNHMPSCYLPSTKMHLAAGLYPDQLGELTVLPRSPWKRDGTRGIERERDRERVGGEVE